MKMVSLDTEILVNVSLFGPSFAMNRFSDTGEPH